jgi:serine/threonine protein kinase
MSPLATGRPLPRLGDGRFAVVDQIGDGGTASVYLAWDEAEGRWCALKALHTRLMRDQEMRRRFTQEASALALLVHPNVPQLYAHDPDAIPPFTVMELARCGSAMDWVRENGPMPPAIAGAVILAVCEALAEAHAIGILHRDVKPANFLLDDAGVPKLTDFGIARVADATSLTATGSQIGTFSYMAPEQRSDTKSVDHRADIYSVGASLYTLICGRSSAELFIADKDDAILAAVPPAFRPVILRATRYEPDERPATIRDLQAEVRAALALLPPPNETDPPLVAPREPLPERPPAVLPSDRRFEDLERALGLDPDEATFTPVDRTPLETQSPRVMPYVMPPRVPTPDRPEEVVVVPDYVDISEVGALRRAHEEQVRAADEREARARALRNTPPPSAEVVEERHEHHRVLGGLAGAILAGVLLALIALASGVSALRTSRGTVDRAAGELNAALLADGDVIYALPGDRTPYESIFAQFREAKGHARVTAALAFVDAVDAAVDGTTHLDATVAGQVERLEAARDVYLDARTAHRAAAARFPGLLAVRSGLVPQPD